MKKGQNLFLFTFLAGPFALFAYFVVSPYAQAFYFGMTDWGGFSPSFNFVGADNFVAILTGQGLSGKVFWAGLRNNLILLITVPILTIALSLFFATMLNLAGATRSGRIAGVRGSAFYRILFFIPQVISAAALGIMFQQFFQPNGLLNSFIRAILPSVEPPAWMADSRFALACVIAVMVWMHTGFYMVYFTAAMASIPKEMLEAAAIDRAGRFATFRLVTLPMLWPAVQTALIYLAIFSMDALAIVQVMTVGPGGPDNSTTVMALSMFQSKQQAFFGFASAQGVVIFVLTFALALLTLRMTRRDQVEL